MIQHEGRVINLTFFLVVFSLLFLILNGIGCSPRSVERLIDRLERSRDPKVRHNAAKQLGEKKDARAVPPLLLAMDDEYDLELRRIALEALTRIGDKAIDVLIDRLSTKDIYQHEIYRRNAAFALGAIRNKRAVSPLIQAMRDSDSEIAATAADALSKIGEPAADRLCALMCEEDTNWNVLRYAQKSLIEIGTPSVGYLIANLAKSSINCRRMSAEALGNIKDALAAPALVKLLRDDDKKIISYAEVGLRQIGTHAVKPLIVALDDINQNGRYQAIRLLGDIGDARAVEPLIGCLDDWDQDIRYVAITALGDIGDARAVEPLIGCLKNNDSKMRSKAITALGKIRDPRVLEAVLSAMRDQDVSVKERATEVLGEIGDIRCAESLISALKDKEPSVRQRAAEALGSIADPEAVEELIAVLNDRDNFVQNWAVKSLVKMGKIATHQLILAMEHKSPDVRCNAVQALGEIGDLVAVEPLISALKDKEPRVRRRVTESFLKIKDSRSAQSLIAVLDDIDPDVRRNASWALGDMDTTATQPLLVALDKKDLKVLSKTYPFFIRKGIKNSEVVLVEVLNRYGTEEMAEDFLNSNSDQLREAGYDWARRNKFEVMSIGGRSGPTWGN